jgi:2-methylcitrate dehydratase PrpD
VLAAIIAGHEVTCRVALALPAGEHYDRGYHPTATCGAFGAAAAARVFGLDTDGVAGALGQLRPAGRPHRRSLLPKVECVFDAEIEAWFPTDTSGKLTIEGRRKNSSGLSWSQGEPSNFLSQQELRAKFACLTDAVLGADRVTALTNAVLATDATADVSTLTRLGRPADGRPASRGVAARGGGRTATSRLEAEGNRG